MGRVIYPTATLPYVFVWLSHGRILSEWVDPGMKRCYQAARPPQSLAAALHHSTLLGSVLRGPGTRPPARARATSIIR